jgi:F-type H+-transporting ATPase subunit beta
VGEEVLGHIFNVIGEPLDVDAATLGDLERWDIHRDPPPFDQLEPVRRCSRRASRSSTS